MGNWCFLSCHHACDKSALAHQTASSWAEGQWGLGSRIPIFVHSSQLWSVAMEPLCLILWNCIRRKQIFIDVFDNWEAMRPWPDCSTSLCLSLPTCELGRGSRWHKQFLLTVNLCDVVILWWCCLCIWATLETCPPYLMYVYFDMRVISFSFPWHLGIILPSFPAFDFLQKIRLELCCGFNTPSFTKRRTVMLFTFFKLK